ncbi:hypothetical protein HU200_021998 [Digitaria exilis]|uniref:DUF1618 domain-containing protein n=1 Tax=Digitaria exilis TaxID=1010633 RepID=A0A835C5G8_9POAL|nr:hypothetical protein HU200_021998 [Digitaria exilis]
MVTFLVHSKIHRRSQNPQPNPFLPSFSCHSKPSPDRPPPPPPPPPYTGNPDPKDMASSSSSSSLPDWALVDPYIFRRDDDSFPADEPTEASCTNSRGDEIRVCFELHEPPRPSRIYLSWPKGTEDWDRFDVVAAHRDAVLFQMAYAVPVPRREYAYDMYDYFVYRAGGGGTPSLHRLPSVYGTVDEFRALFKSGTFHYTDQNLRRIEGLDIAVLRRGEKDVAVAELQIIRSEKPELHVIVPSKSTSRWKVKRPRFIHDPELDLEDFLWNWCADTVVPFGENLYWVDYCQGAALFCKVFDDTHTHYASPLAMAAALALPVTATVALELCDTALCHHCPHPSLAESPSFIPLHPCTGHHCQPSSRADGEQVEEEEEALLGASIGKALWWQQARTTPDHGNVPRQYSWPVLI